MEKISERCDLQSRETLAHATLQERRNTQYSSPSFSPPSNISMPQYNQQHQAREPDVPQELGGKVPSKSRRQINSIQPSDFPSESGSFIKILITAYKALCDPTSSLTLFLTKPFTHQTHSCPRSFTLAFSPQKALLPDPCITYSLHASGLNSNGTSVLSYTIPKTLPVFLLYCSLQHVYLFICLFYLFCGEGSWGLTHACQGSTLPLNYTSSPIFFLKLTPPWPGTKVS